MFQKENAFNSSEIGSLNRILARESQYSATCSLGPEEEELVVKALISDPVSATFTRGGVDRVGPGLFGFTLTIFISAISYNDIMKRNV